MADTTMPDFLDQLVDWLAARLGINRAVAPFSLWSHAIDESSGATTNLADPATVLRVYGGQPLTPAPVGHALIQTYTIGKYANTANQFAGAVRGGFLTTQFDAGEVGLPMRAFTLNDFYVNGIINLSTPGMIGRDAMNRPEVVFNFEAFYVARAQST